MLSDSADGAVAKKGFLLLESTLQTTVSSDFNASSTNDTSLHQPNHKSSCKSRLDCTRVFVDGNGSGAGAGCGERSAFERFPSPVVVDCLTNNPRDIRRYAYLTGVGVSLAMLSRLICPTHVKRLISVVHSILHWSQVTTSKPSYLAHMVDGISHGGTRQYSCGMESFRKRG